MMAKSSVIVRYRNGGSRLKATLHCRWLQYDWSLAGTGRFKEARRLREREIYSFNAARIFKSLKLSKSGLCLTPNLYQGLRSRLTKRK